MRCLLYVSTVGEYFFVLTSCRLGGFLSLSFMFLAFVPSHVTWGMPRDTGPLPCSQLIDQSLDTKSFYHYVFKAVALNSGTAQDQGE